MDSRFIGSVDADFGRAMLIRILVRKRQKEPRKGLVERAAEKIRWVIPLKTISITLFMRTTSTTKDGTRRWVLHHSASSMRSGRKLGGCLRQIVPVTRLLERSGQVHSADLVQAIQNVHAKEALHIIFNSGQLAV